MPRFENPMNRAARRRAQSQSSPAARRKPGKDIRNDPGRNGAKHTPVLRTMLMPGKGRNR